MSSLPVLVFVILDFGFFSSFVLSHSFSSVVPVSSTRSPSQGMNSPQLAFVGATAITPFEEIPDSAAVLAGNRMVVVGPRRSLPTNPTTETIDVSGKFIAPGFIDIHIHGGAGSDFMDATR